MNLYLYDPDSELVLGEIGIEGNEECFADEIIAILQNNLKKNYRLVLAKSYTVFPYGLGVHMIRFEGEKK